MQVVAAVRERLQQPGDGDAGRARGGGAVPQRRARRRTARTRRRTLQPRQSAQVSATRTRCVSEHGALFWLRGMEGVVAL